MKDIKSIFWSAYPSEGGGSTTKSARRLIV